MLSITAPLCEFTSRPIGLGTRSPRFSFCVTAAPGHEVVRYRIQVASDPAMLANAQDLTVLSSPEGEQQAADLWDSGWQSVSSSPLVEYGGRRLDSRQRAWWRAWVADDRDDVVGLTDPEPFEIGLLEPEDWVAEWIGHPGSPAGGALYLRQPFVLDRPVLQARLYVSGLGWFQARLNGHRVGRQELDPMPTDTSRRVPYCTFDVTDLLRDGVNVLGGVLGHGWYGAHKYLAQLEMTLADGTRLVACTGHAGVGTQMWNAYHGPIVVDSIYDGETFDSRLENPAWDVQGDFEVAPMRDLQAAMLVDAPGGILVAQDLEPIEVVESVRPVAITTPRPGTVVVDAGRNLAGWARLRADGPRGHMVTLAFAEVLGADGLVNQENLRAAAATDRLILHGAGPQTWEPTFTYHGFRYIQVDGYPGALDADDLQVQVVRSALPRRARFSCDDPLITAIDRAVIDTEASNLHGVPTDCPQRNERMGWLNDLAARTEELVYSFDTARFLPKWVHDIADTQDRDGAIADTAPYRFGTRPGDPVSVCFALIPWLLYTHHGDLRTAQTHFPAIRRWFDYLTSRSVDRVVQYSHYGDWSPPVAHGLDGESPLSADTPGTLISTAHYFATATLLARIAEALGRDEDAKQLWTEAALIEQAFNQTFWRSPEIGYGSGNQACNAVALYFGLVPSDRLDDIVAALVREVRAADTHLTTGNLCTKYVLEALVEHGQGELAVDLVLQRSYPSWGYMIDNGATTIWERWENATGGGMNSHNHPMYASVGAWFHRRLAGLMIPDDAVGASSVLIEPLTSSRLGRAASRIRTGRGELSSSWIRTADGVDLHVVIPAGTRARVRLAVDGRDSVRHDSGPLVLPSSVTDSGVLEIAVGPGSHRFSY